MCEGFHVLTLSNMWIKIRSTQSQFFIRHVPRDRGADFAKQTYFSVPVSPWWPMMFYFFLELCYDTKIYLWCSIIFFRSLSLSSHLVYINAQICSLHYFTFIFLFQFTHPRVHLFVLFWKTNKQVKQARNVLTWHLWKKSGLLFAPCKFSRKQLRRHWICK